MSASLATLFLCVPIGIYLASLSVRRPRSRPGQPARPPRPRSRRQRPLHGVPCLGESAADVLPAAKHLQHLQGEDLIAALGRPLPGEAVPVELPDSAERTEPTARCRRPTAPRAGEAVHLVPVVVARKRRDTQEMPAALLEELRARCRAESDRVSVPEAAQVQL